MPVQRTTYVILRKFTEAEGTDLWQVIGDAEGVDDLAAIRQVATQKEGETYIAVPKRSFRPRTGTLEPRPPVFKLT